MRLLAFVALVTGALLGGRPAAAQDVSPKGYIEMPQAEDGAWVLTSPPGSGRNWGTPEFVRYLALVAREWRRRHPDLPRLRLGDLSKPDGSTFPPHKTHKDGLTADIFTSPKNICHVNYPNQEHTLELAQLMVDYGARQILYNGELVVSKVPIAKKWPKHDNHFHIVIDPSRVPADGAPLVMPTGGVKDGAWVPRSALEEDLTGLELTWRVLGGMRLKHCQITVERGGETVHESGPVKPQGSSYDLPVPLEDQASYRWKVDVLTSNGQEASSGWQTVRTDFVEPEVVALGPREEEEVLQAPTLRWKFVKRGVAQSSYRIELDGDPSHRKVSDRLGPFEGTAGEHRLVEKKLKRNKRYFWRVVATDAHANEGASEWQMFRTGRLYGKAKRAPDQGGGAKKAPRRAGKVNASSLNVRQGPGTSHPVVTVLKQGTEVQILGESSGWLEIEANGKRGFVAARFVTE